MADENTPATPGSEPSDAEGSVLPPEATDATPTPRADLGSTNPYSPFFGDDPEIHQPTTLLQPVAAEPPAPQPAPAPAPIPPYDPAAAQLTNVAPAVATAPYPAAEAPLPVAPSVPTVLAGSRVVVIVSRGASPVPQGVPVNAPNVLGKPQGEALSLLQSAGLSAQVFTDFSDRPRGEVVMQLPAAGATAPTGSEAVLLISGGPAAASTLRVPLPDTIGLSEADALARLQTAGLSPQIVRDFNPVVPLGVVIEQVPSGAMAAGESKSKAMPLWWLWLLLALAIIFAASGGAYWWLNRRAVVPNLVGLSRQQAQKAIEAAGFKLGSVSTTESLTTVQVGKVVAQSPKPNTEWRMIDQINITISNGTKSVSIPDVTGRPQADARQTLTSVGLLVSVDQTYSATVPTDSVISQSPAVGQTVSAGTTVGLTVSLGRVGSAPPGSSTVPVITPTTPNANQVAVPAVTNLTQSAAQSAIRSAGLKYTTTSEANATIAKGLVVSQSLVAGSLVQKGAVVALVVSSGTAPVTTTSMPSITANDLVDAKAAVKSANLTFTALGVKALGYAGGSIVGQYPPATTSLKIKRQVLIVYFSGATSLNASNTPDNVQMPWVRGLTQKKATKSCGDQGLGVTIFTWTGSGQSAGTVLQQFPASDRYVKKGTNVVLVVAK